MHIYRTVLLCLLLTIVLPGLMVAQDSALNALMKQIPVGYVDGVGEKAGKLAHQLERKSKKMLDDFARQEAKLKRQLDKLDSNAAKEAFSAAAEQLQSFQQKLQVPQKLVNYFPDLDSLKTSLKFIGNYDHLLADAKGAGQKLNASLAEINELELKLQQAEMVKQFIKDQQLRLKDQLSRFGMTKQLQKLNRKYFYYSQQIQEYKEILKDRRKAERKALELLAGSKVFKDFMKKNSVLAQMFRMPASDPLDPAYAQVIGGLQSRTQIDQLIQNRLGSNSAGVQQQLQQSIAQAQGELQKLKTKLLQSNPGADDPDMPDFKPNSQRTKSLAKRLVWGFDIQSQKSYGVFPTSTDLGLSLGFKASDRSVIGIGASYRAGWGTGFKNIRITHQGASGRIFIDYKIKNSFWLAGGFEMNYRSEIKNVDQLKNISAWQTSGLIGISKKIPLKSSLVKNTSVNLMWDFLSYYQIPRPAPFVFRAGYQF